MFGKAAAPKGLKTDMRSIDGCGEDFSKHLQFDEKNGIIKI